MLMCIWNSHFGLYYLYSSITASGDKEERNCDYEIKGKEIYLTAEGETVKALEIKGDSLIVYGITNLDGSIVLKKK